MKKYLVPLLGALLLSGIVGGAVFVRFKGIEAAKTKKLHTFPTLYSEFGKPVEVMEVKKGSLTLSVLVTAVVKSKNRLEAFVEGQTFEGLNQGARFRGLEQYSDLLGELTKISQRRDLQTGLYRVTMISDDKLPKRGTLVPMEIDVKSVENRTILPVGAITPRKGKLLAWKIEGDKVVSTRVKIGLYNKHFLEVLEGVKEGDQIVTKGAGLLQSGDKYRIVKSN